MTLIEADLFQSWSDALYAVKVKRLKVVETNSLQSWTETLNRIQLQGLELKKQMDFNPKQKLYIKSGFQRLKLIETNSFQSWTETL